MTSEWITTAVQIAVGVFCGGGTTYGVFRFFNERRKLKIVASSEDVASAAIINTAAIGLLAPAREQVEFLARELANANNEVLSYRARVISAEAEIAKLAEHVRELSAQVRELIKENEALRDLLHIPPSHLAQLPPEGPTPSSPWERTE